MMFSEYFNALYPYLAYGEEKVTLFDKMISNFIHEEDQDNCKILDCKPDTKRRYIQEGNSNKINPEYARYLYSKHNPQGYQKWLKDRLFQLETYDKVEEWLNLNKIEFNDVRFACDDLLESIFFNIGYPNAPGDTELKLPEKNTEGRLESSHLTENDRELLKDFHIDFDSMLEKFIMSDQTGVLLASGLQAKIDGLYKDKWKDQISAFDDLELQSEILSTIATLKELCRNLDPDSKSASGSSVHRLRTKLRNTYVKLHPDNYVDIFPYEVFIDDWNDGEE